jgi:hypothetical protein
MRGIYSDDDNKGDGDRQPPPVLAAWIADLLRDVRATHLRRLDELRARLQSEAFDWDDSALAQAISAVHSAGRELHVRELRQGWIDKLMGRHRAVYARFAAAYDRIVDCAGQMKRAANDLASRSKSHETAVKRMLVEFEMDMNAIHTEIEQGLTWLQDMCAQLAEAAAQGGEQPELAECAEAAKAFTDYFKRLEAVTSMGHDIRVRALDVQVRRAALVEQARADAESFEKTWVRDVGKVAAIAQSGGDPARAASRVAEQHDEFMKRLSQCADACSALQHEEHLLEEQLQALGSELDAFPA